MKKALSVILVFIALFFSFVAGCFYVIETAEKWCTDIPYDENGVLGDELEVGIRLFGKFYDCSVYIG